MFHGLGSGTPSSVARRTHPGRHTSVTLKGPSQLGESLWSSGDSPTHRVQINIEVASLNVETALSRPLDGDAGILSRAPAVELRPQVFCSCTPYGGGAHGRRRTALTLAVRYHRIAGQRSLPSPCRTGRGLSQVEETVNIIPPLSQGVWRGCCGRRVAKQIPSRRQRSAARSL